MGILLPTSLPETQLLIPATRAPWRLALDMNFKNFITLTKNKYGRLLLIKINKINASFVENENPFISSAVNVCVVIVTSM